jgi:hypothetical protein
LVWFVGADELAESIQRGQEVIMFSEMRRSSEHDDVLVAMPY